MTGPSIHDNNVYAYAVLCDERQIVLHTEFKEVAPAEHTDVIFNRLHNTCRSASCQNSFSRSSRRTPRMVWQFASKDPGRAAW